MKTITVERPEQNIIRFINKEDMLVAEFDYTKRSIKSAIKDIAKLFDCSQKELVNLLTK